jgi:Flp pilus assembly protein TadG
MRPAHNNPEKGAAIVECALVLPALLLILVVCIDLGLLMREHQVLQNAAREGARVACLPVNPAGSQDPATLDQMVKDRVTGYLQGENITVAAGNITVDRQYSMMVGASTIYTSRVTVNHTRSLLLSGGSLLPIGQVTLHGAAVFRNLY